jgi:hypothetical protein
MGQSFGDFGLHFSIIRLLFIGFRQSFSILRQATEDFARSNTDFNILLGDILDGRAKKLGLNHLNLFDLREVTPIIPYQPMIGFISYFPRAPKSGIPR